MATNNRYYQFINRDLYTMEINYDNNFFSNSNIQVNDIQDIQVIEEAKRIHQVIKQKFANPKCGFGESLYITYHDIINGESRLNAVTQSYVKNKFNSEVDFRCYYMRHKDAPQLPFDRKG